MKMQEEKYTEEYVLEDDFGGKEKTGFKAKMIGFLDGWYFIPVLMVLALVTAFFLGRISAVQEAKPPVRIIYENSGEVKGLSIDNTRAGTAPADLSAQVVGSKNGTKYHYSWCAGAKQISDKNLITFNSIEEARAKGYTPAANCKGLK